MIVYRVENASGVGPYHGSMWHPSRHQNKLTHPNPMWDEGMCEEWARRVGGMYGSQYVFGFKSMEQLHEWFNAEELEHVREYKYDIVAFEVAETDVIMGERQLAFVRASAQMLLITQGAA